MRKFLLIFPFLLGLQGLNAQTTYYRYNKAGVPERIGYSTPTPDPNAAFSKYVPKIDPAQYERTQEAYVRGGLEKQAAYDNNVKKLKSLIETTKHLIEGMNPGEYKTSCNNLLNSYLETMNRGKFDYGDHEVYSYWYLKIYKILPE